MIKISLYYYLKVGNPVESCFRDVLLAPEFYIFVPLNLIILESQIVIEIF